MRYRTFTFLFLVFCCFFLIPSFLSPVAAQKGAFGLLSYNIRNGKGMDGKTDLDRTATVINSVGADVVALQEVDSATKRSSGLNVLSALADRTGMRGVFGAAIPYQGGSYGVAVLSKEKPRRHYTVALPGREEGRVLLVVEFKRYIIFATHLSLTAADRAISLRLIDSVAGGYTKPIYLLGDFNAEPGDAVVTGLQANWRLLSGVGLTFPADKPVKCIDFIFSRNSKRKVQTARVLEDGVTSDHRAVEVRF